MKSDLLEKMMPRVLPTTRHIDALIFNDHRRAVLFAVSHSVREHFAKMFRGSFGIELDACGPRALARIRAGEGAHDAIDKLMPTKWPVAKAGV